MKKNTFRLTMSMIVFLGALTGIFSIFGQKNPPATSAARPQVISSEQEKKLYRVAELWQESHPMVPLQGAQKPILEKGTDPNQLFGFFVSLETKKGKMIAMFDPAEFISNEHVVSIAPGAADIAAIADGQCGVLLAEAHLGSCAPNGFYIRNNSSTTKTFEIPSTAKIQLLSYVGDDNGSLKSVSRETFIRSLNDPTEYYSPEGPYIIDFIDGAVTAITARYIP